MGKIFFNNNHIFIFLLIRFLGYIFLKIVQQKAKPNFLYFRYLWDTFYNLFFITGHHPEFETTNKKIKLFNIPGQGHDHFVFKEIHVHTGALETAGSEHSIDNNFTPIEVRIRLIKYS